MQLPEACEVFKGIEYKKWREPGDREFLISQYQSTYEIHGWTVSSLRIDEDPKDIAAVDILNLMRMGCAARPWPLLSNHCALST